MPITRIVTREGQVWLVVDMGEGRIFETLCPQWLANRALILDDAGRVGWIDEVGYNLATDFFIEHEIPAEVPRPVWAVGKSAALREYAEYQGLTVVEIGI